MKKLFFLLLICGLIQACFRRPQPVTLENGTSLNGVFIQQFGSMIDSSFDHNSDLKTLCTFKSIDIQGRITKIDQAQALELYREAQLYKELTVYPIFEVKHSKQVILIVRGKGLWDRIWARVLVDRSSGLIEKVEFGHQAETPGLGAEIVEPDFERQFKRIMLKLDDNTFSLYQMDSLIISGEHRIDGISGATITSKGVIEMLNKGLVMYKPYLV